jgi:hypothetical protein
LGLTGLVGQSLANQCCPRAHVGAHWVCRSLMAQPIVAPVAPSETLIERLRAGVCVALHTSARAHAQMRGVRISCATSEAEFLACFGSHPGLKREVDRRTGRNAYAIRTQRGDPFLATVFGDANWWWEAQRGGAVCAVLGRFWLRLVPQEATSVLLQQPLQRDPATLQFPVAATRTFRSTQLLCSFNRFRGVVDGKVLRCARAQVQ